MANPELGAKQICPNDQTKFYDLNKRPAKCPKCGFEFDPEEALKSRRGARGRPVPNYEDDQPAEKPVRDEDAEELEEEADATPEIDAAADEPDPAATDDDDAPAVEPDAGVSEDFGEDAEDPAAEDDDDVPFLEEEEDDDAFPEDDIEGGEEPGEREDR